METERKVGTHNGNLRVLDRLKKISWRRWGQAVGMFALVCAYLAAAPDLEDLAMNGVIPGNTGPAPLAGEICDQELLAAVETNKITNKSQIVLFDLSEGWREREPIRLNEIFPDTQLDKAEHPVVENDNCGVIFSSRNSLWRWRHTTVKNSLTEILGEQKINQGIEEVMMGQKNKISRSIFASKHWPGEDKQASGLEPEVSNIYQIVISPYNPDLVSFSLTVANFLNSQPQFFTYDTNRKIISYYVQGQEIDTNDEGSTFRNTGKYLQFHDLLAGGYFTMDVNNSVFNPQNPQFCGPRMLFTAINSDIKRRAIYQTNWRLDDPNLIVMGDDFACRDRNRIVLEDNGNLFLFNIKNRNKSTIIDKSLYSYSEPDMASP